jgi:hypothetical protein
MTIDTLQEIWNSYQAAWANIAPEERERLLRQSVTDDVAFTTPTGEGQGFGTLVAHVAQFQTQFSGAYFKSNKLVSHHGQLLSEWTMFSKDGAEILTAHSYARFNEQGLLTHLAGFWQA